MITIALSCLLLVVLTTVIHYEALRALGSSLSRLDVPARAKLIVVILATFLAHSLEMLLYGFAFFALVHYFGLGTLGGHGALTLTQSVYFSAETYTSLGFGDIVPTGPIRLLAGAETLNGLLLIGWTASYTYIAMERYWRANGAPR
jgi:hypothetical protein